MIPQATWRAVVDLHQRQRVAIGKKEMSVGGATVRMRLENGCRDIP
jgi:hypothetical protein